MTYPTRRARIQAEAAAQSAARSRRGRSLAAGAAGLATLAGATIAGVAPAAANDAAVSSSSYSQQNTWSYSGETTRSASTSTAASTSTGTSGSTYAGSTGTTASTSYSGSTGGVSLGTGIQRASYTTASTATGANAVAANYATAKATDPNTYYSWGGNGPYGFDCSGLTQQAFAAAGKSIPRGSGAQYTGASQYVSLDNLQVGDLVFWSNNGSASGIYHVAMYVGDGQIAHARNPVTGVSLTAVDYNPTNMLGTAARY
ncbi:C40 family peptidase [Micrococcus terreus]|uniref:Cell wall-associated hydrolase, NlpC family n=1 Tax=Micrococcus terreus TaxID=574650 RepID=A0A1I7MRB6_9MICC|nr:C40 family peptidase [Micrococcus terreus]SFV24456.1 Cell wall-associated hydrolase, NlpC family [Micrococcus terreus]